MHLARIWGNWSIPRWFDYIRTTAFTLIWPSKVAHNHCWGLLGPGLICLLSSPKSGFPFILQKKLVLSAITSTNLIKQNRPLSFWGVYSILHKSKYLTIFLKEHSTHTFQCFESKPNRPLIHDNQNKIKGIAFYFFRHLTFHCFLSDPSPIIIVQPCPHLPQRALDLKSCVLPIFLQEPF